MSEENNSKKIKIPNNAATDTGKRVALESLPAPRTTTLRRKVDAKTVVADKPKGKASSKRSRPTPRKTSAPILRGEKTISKEDSPVSIAPKIKRPAPTEFDDSGDFEQMLSEMAPIEQVTAQAGDRIRVQLSHVAGDSAFFSMGGKVEGYLPTSEITSEDGTLEFNVGDFLEGTVVSIGEGIVLSRKGGISGKGELSAVRSAYEAGLGINGKVAKTNSGGFEVMFGSARGFCPMSQLKIGGVSEPEAEIGKVYTFKITKFDEKGRNIVVSHRTFQEEERKRSEVELLEKLSVGDTIEGTVARHADFGAFVDLGGVEGLVPMSELGFGHYKKAEEAVLVGQKVSVLVKRIEDDPKRNGRKRISLSLKEVLPDPFLTHHEALKRGASLPGKVVRLETYGAFIELFEGIVGLIHISEMSQKRIRHPSDILKEGEAVEARISDIDFETKKISLSLKPENEAPVPRRGKKEPSVKSYQKSNSFGTFGDLFKKL